MSWSLLPGYQQSWIAANLNEARSTLLGLGISSRGSEWYRASAYTRVKFSAYILSRTKNRQGRHISPSDMIDPK